LAPAHRDNVLLVVRRRETSRQIRKLDTERVQVTPGFNESGIKHHASAGLSRFFSQWLRGSAPYGSHGPSSLAQDGQQLLSGIEIMHMIRQGQLSNGSARTVADRFYLLVM